MAIFNGGNIVELTLPKFDTIDSNFGTILYEIKEVNLPDTDIIGDNFFSETRWDSLEILNMPKVQYVGDSFLFANRDLRIWNAPKLVKIGSQPLNYNHALKSLYLPEYIGSETLLYNNKNLTSVYVPKLKEHNPKEYERLQSIVEKNKKAQTAIQSIEKVKGV